MAGNQRLRPIAGQNFPCGRIFTPFRAPKANAVAERWVRSVRQECLNHLLILYQRHFARMFKEYVH